MLSKTMHPRTAELATELFALTENAPARPTKIDRDKLMAVRNKIKKLGDDDGTNFGTNDETDRQYLYVESTLAANRQEDFYEQNGNKWAT